MTAEYVAVPRKWCIAHSGVMEEDEFCEYADNFETPCEFRRLFIERTADAEKKFGNPEPEHPGSEA